jgi:hypothetical protein
MTDPQYTHIAILADRSTSMGEHSDPPRTKAQDATKGIRQLIADQAALPGRTTFTLVQFSTVGVDEVVSFVRGDDKTLAAWKIEPWGGTPLRDAMGKTITSTGTILTAMPEDKRPGRVYFVTATDGEENSSREYTQEQLKAMVEHQRDAYKWEFVFIGADIDAFAEGAKIGMGAGQTLQTVDVAMAASYGATSDAMTRSRASGQSVTYTQAERDKAAGKP